MTNGLETVTARLGAEVAAHRLQFDGAQYAAAQRLDTLRDELLRSPTLLRRLCARMGWLPGESPQPPSRGLYLWGGVGRGKTLLMDLFFACMQRAAPPTGFRRAAERTHFYHFMRDVHASLAAVRGHAAPLEIVAQRVADRTRVICLDEFFVADIADAMILAALFDGLFRRGVALVATSNVPPEELYEDGLQRQRFLPAIELLQANVDVVHLDGAVDYRLRQLERAPTYLDSNIPGTAAALAARFAALAGGQCSGPATLSIEGRSLSASDTGPGMVAFDFAELCDGPRSQNDYIELAHLYHTVFVADIPIFETADDDSARRFIMLIDELYDRGVKLVVSAAAPAAALYRGERLRREFERAASRLVEMQAQRYLAGQHRP